MILEVMGELPVGCTYCEKGAKMVLFVTGRCARRCFYCPTSEKRRHKDATYANERLAKSDDEIIDEANKMSALGTGITGGDPMVVPERTLHFIELLKDRFGGGHHVHLYTGILFDRAHARRLSEAGLDEIRFHPPSGIWHRMGGSAYGRLLEAALQTKMDAGVEIPALPGYENKMLALVKYLDETGADFLNLNELESSETNYRALNRKGYHAKGDATCGVEGSREAAMHVLKNADAKISLHYCSSSFKDAVQLRNRLLRRAKNVAKGYEVITDDGTLLKGIVEADDLDAAANYIIKKFPPLKGFLRIERGRIEVEPGKLKAIAKKIPYRCFIVEEYPTEDRFEVEREEL